MRVDPLELEVAFDLVELVDPSRGGDLLDRVKALRRKVAMDTGLVIPLVRTRDNLDLPGSQYVIWLNGVPAAKGISPPGTILAIGHNRQIHLEAIEEERVDRELGIIGGDIGAPNLRHPPPTHGGLYHTSSLGFGGTGGGYDAGEGVVAEGPMNPPAQ